MKESNFIRRITEKDLVLDIIIWDIDFWRCTCITISRIASHTKTNGIITAQGDQMNKGEKHVKKHNEHGALFLGKLLLCLEAIDNKVEL